MKKSLRTILLGLGLACFMFGNAQAKEPAAPAAAPAAAATKTKAPLIDINTASKKELSSLPKIGEARSEAIIKGRPYKAKDELVDKKILTPAVYKEIKDLIIAKQAK